MVQVTIKETFQLMGLYGREPDLSSDIKERFAKLCEEHGILRENIIQEFEQSKRKNPAMYENDK